MPRQPTHPTRAATAGTDPRVDLRPELAVANIYPSITRALLSLIEERGHSAERLCRGLGFHYRDLRDPLLLLSYQQSRALIVRAQDLLGPWALGLACGARQSPVSWGIAGLGLLTCETYGEAIEFGQQHPYEFGAMMSFGFEARGSEFAFEVQPLVFDTRIEAFLVEEGLCSLLSVSRHLIGSALKPLRVELGYARAGAEGPYARFFRCPVRFGAGRHRMTFDARWLDARLPGHDPLTSSFVRRQLDPLLAPPAVRESLVDAVARRLRFDPQERPTQTDLARQMNLSERTLRRRLGTLAAPYRTLRDQTLFEKARDLLGNPGLTVAEVAHAVGYADAAAFRRAFKRWSGQLPTEFRQATIRSP
jgi:AraC-like DNA-binding protein